MLRAESGSPRPPSRDARCGRRGEVCWTGSSLARAAVEAAAWFWGSNKAHAWLLQRGDRDEVRTLKPTLRPWSSISWSPWAEKPGSARVRVSSGCDPRLPRCMESEHLVARLVVNG
jgi:hypothetical protein